MKRTCLIRLRSNEKHEYIKKSEAIVESIVSDYINKIRIFLYDQSFLSNASKQEFLLTNSGTISFMAATIFI